MQKVLLQTVEVARSVEEYNRVWDHLVQEYIPSAEHHEVGVDTTPTKFPCGLAILVRRDAFGTHITMIDFSVSQAMDVVDAALALVTR